MALAAPVVNTAANRIVSGQDVALAAASLPALAAVLAAWLAVAASAFAPAGRWAAWAVPAPLAAWAWAAAQAATAFAGNDSVARVTLGPGIWLSAVLVVVVVLALPLRPASRWLAAGAAAIPLLAAAAAGLFDSLSLWREARALGPNLARELGQHLILTGGAVTGGLVLGLALGTLAHRSKLWRQGGFVTLNFLQTLPSLALFGLLILPLAWLSETFPVLRDWGIKGIGPAPALIALTLYAALPIARNTLTALDEVPAAVLDAGRGLGMSPLQVAGRVVIPLAWPTVLAGVRVAAVQTVGNVVVAAFIGAGGLGVFIFQGLGQTAMDLVLLGTLPVVGLALLLDLVLGLPRVRRGAAP